jgi:anti-sigma B factor antagonist
LNFQVDSNEKVTIVKLNREFSLTSIPELNLLWEKILQKKPAVIAFDFKMVEFIDSSAIGTMVKFLNETKRLNIKLLLVNFNSSILKIFKTAKLTSIFTILEEFDFPKD